MRILFSYQKVVSGNAANNTCENNHCQNSETIKRLSFYIVLPPFCLNSALPPLIVISILDANSQLVSGLIG